jgi:ribonuclease P protein component
VHELLRDDREPSRVGFAVGRTVGNAVRRNTLKRQLRHLMRERIGGLADHSSVVVRANPAAAATGFARLGDDLDGCLRSLARRRGRP